MRGVYKLFYRGVLVYVGVSENIPRRLRNHHVKFDRFESIEGAGHEVEKRLLRSLSPPLNKNSKTEEMENTAITLPRPLVKAAKKRSEKLYGRRKFSEHVRKLLEKDLAEAK